MPRRKPKPRKRPPQPDRQVAELLRRADGSVRIEIDMGTLPHDPFKALDVVCKILKAAQDPSTFEPPPRRLRRPRTRVIRAPAPGRYS